MRGSSSSYFLFNLQKKRNHLLRDSFFITLRENECSTFVEQCLKNFFFLFSFQVFVCLFFFIASKNKLCRVQFQVNGEGGRKILLPFFSQPFLLLIKRKSSCVFKLNKAYAKRKLLTNDKQSNRGARQGLVILIKLLNVQRLIWSSDVKLFAFRKNEYSRIIW